MAFYEVLNRNLSLNCEDVVNLVAEQVVASIPFHPVVIEEPTHAKLAFNLSSMVASEERFTPIQEIILKSFKPKTMFVNQ